MLSPELREQYDSSIVRNPGVNKYEEDIVYFLTSGRRVGLHTVSGSDMVKQAMHRMREYVDALDRVAGRPVESGETGETGDDDVRESDRTTADQSSGAVIESP